VPLGQCFNPAETARRRHAVDDGLQLVGDAGETETTTSTRACSSAARSRISWPMMSQRCRRETLVPPNFRTIQSSALAMAIMGGRGSSAKV
jgi:hypothetical protein